MNTTIPELSNIANILEQTEPTINDVNDHLKKQEHKAKVPLNLLKMFHHSESPWLEMREITFRFN